LPAFETAPAMETSKSIIRRKKLRALVLLRVNIVENRDRDIKKLSINLKSETGQNNENVDDVKKQITKDIVKRYTDNERWQLMKDVFNEKLR
jgi:ribosomal protein L14E/L6E/L27E